MPEARPNLLFIMADDHAAHAIGSYGSAINTTPHIDRLATAGMRFDNCFCTNAICAPSRAAILTGTYNHVNGVRTMPAEFDSTQPSFPALLHAAGYQTALFGKWHLGHGPGHDPVGFDEWQVLPGQGEYHDPDMINADGRVSVPGYVTDVITDLGLSWLDRRDRERPFCLLLHHKAPHRRWQPDVKHAALFDDELISEPATFRDDYSHRARAARAARMRVDRHLRDVDLKADVPPELDDGAAASWKYQRYIKDYLRCVASIDDNVGRVLAYLDENDLANDTMVVYTSDQGFFLGDHGWYDKRFMYEESLRMPLVVRYPAMVRAGSECDGLVTNVDLAPTFLDLAKVPAPDRMQGRSLRPLLCGQSPQDWRSSVYYRYWEHDDAAHGVWAHYGIRTPRYKLVYYYSDGLGLPGTSTRTFEPEWEMFDLRDDPSEMHSIYHRPEHRRVRDELTSELHRLQRELGDAPHREERS